MLYILRRRKQGYSFLFFFSLFWVYLLVVVAMVLYPMPIQTFAEPESWRQPASMIFSKINLIPFNYGRYDVSFTYLVIREIVANIIMTVPFGFGISFIIRLRAKSLPALAILVGVGIETSQLIAILILGLDYRTVDINDALMNAVGVLVGYTIFRFIAWSLVELTEHYKLQHNGLFAYIYQICLKAQISVSTYSKPNPK